MRVVRSNYAHGRIVAIDATAARAAPGCVAVWTGVDVAHIPPIEFRPTKVQGLEPYRQHQKTRRAKAALQGMVINEGLLQGMQLAIRLGQALDRA